MPFHYKPIEELSISELIENINSTKIDLYYLWVKSDEYKQKKNYLNLLCDRYNLLKGEVENLLPDD